MKNEKNNPERGDRESRGQQSQPTGQAQSNVQGKAKDNPHEDQIGENAGGNFGTGADSRNQAQMREQGEDSRMSREESDTQNRTESNQSNESSETTENRNQERK